jgi:hypothetical protein
LTLPAVCAYTEQCAVCVPTLNSVQWTLLLTPY